MRHFAGAAGLLLLLGLSGSATAQIPDEFTNLKVLPGDIGKRELVGVMRGFAGSLGVRCSHCHVGPDNLQGMDFAADTKNTKQVARAMMRMVDSINGSHLGAIDFGHEARQQVACRTCHRGVSIPVAIEDLLARVIESEGVDAGVARYRELRDEHYGSDAYDFSGVPLSSLAETLARSELLDAALTVARLNVEFHADDSPTQTLLGGIHAARGELAAAAAALEAAVELDPDNRWAAQQLERLRQAEAEAAPQSNSPSTDR